jgi:hypothetical protein
VPGPGNDPPDLPEGDNFFNNVNIESHPVYSRIKYKQKVLLIKEYCCCCQERTPGFEKNATPALL